MIFFFLLAEVNPKAILKYDRNQTVDGCNFKSMGPINSLVTLVLQNIFFFVQLKNEIHTGLE